MARHELAIQQLRIRFAQGGHEPGERHFRCVRNAGKHALAAKRPVETHAIEAADKCVLAILIPLPAFDRMGEAHVVQALIACLNAMADPASGFAVGCFRIGARSSAGGDDLIEGCIARHREALAAQGACQRAGQAKAIERDDRAQAGFHPEDFRIVARICHGENAGTIGQHQQAGVNDRRSFCGFHASGHNRERRSLKMPSQTCFRKS